MNDKDKDYLSSILIQYKDRCQDISRKINWKAKDSEQLDELCISSWLTSDVANRIMRHTGSMIMTNIAPTFLSYKAWERTKAVYSFNSDFVNDLAQTSDTNIYISLLERLPFKDMLFYFSEGMFPKIKDEETAGIFIHIEKHVNDLFIRFSFIDRKAEDRSKIYAGIVTGFQVTDGMKISELFETPQYLEWLPTYKSTVLLNLHLNEQEAEERILAERTALNTVINLLYYLSSSNADIKAIKNQKKYRKTASGKHGDMPTINLNEVGTKYAEIVYRQWKENKVADEKDDNINTNENDSVRIIKSSKKRRPHARKAHWQHYWTGKGRTIREVRWISDLFVGANRENQAVVVYDMKRESLKGKRNPNTSKKKRKKK